MKNGVLIFFVCLTWFVFCPFVTSAEEVYHLGPGDVIEISVWKDPELSRNLVVPPDGIISFAELFIDPDYPWRRTEIKWANEAGLDLVEISPTAQPPVCKIMDYGKHCYALSKREKDQTRK